MKYSSNKIQVGNVNLPDLHEQWPLQCTWQLQSQRLFDLQNWYQNLLDTQLNKLGLLCMAADLGEVTHPKLLRSITHQQE